MAELTRLDDEDKMPFGTKQGVKMKNLKAWHLLTIWNGGLNKATRDPGVRGKVARYIEYSLQALSKECGDVLVKKVDEE